MHIASGQGESYQKLKDYLYEDKMQIDKKDGGESHEKNNPVAQSERSNNDSQNDGFEKK